MSNLPIKTSNTVSESTGIWETNIKWRIQQWRIQHKEDASKLMSQFAEYWPIHCGMNKMAASITIIRDILFKSSIFRQYFELLTDVFALVVVASN